MWHYDVARCIALLVTRDRARRPCAGDYLHSRHRPRPRLLFIRRVRWTVGLVRSLLSTYCPFCCVLVSAVIL